MNLRTMLAATALSILPTTLAADLTAVPAALELGTVRPGEEVRARVLLVNESDAAVELVKASGSCGCTSVPDFAPTSLEPGKARAFEVVVRAPEKVTEKRVDLVFAAADGSARKLPIALATSESADASTPAAPPTALGAFADAWTLEGEPETTLDASVWIVNTSEAALEVEDVKGSCGCMTVSGEKGYRLAPGEARRVAFRVKLPEKAGTSSKKLTFVTADGAPLVTRWTLETRPKQVAAR